MIINLLLTKDQIFLEVHIFILVNTAVSINMQHIFPINNGYENIFFHI